jgi:hypothetical protein
MKEVQEKLLPGELGVSPRISLIIYPPRMGARGLKATIRQRRSGPRGCQEMGSTTLFRIEVAFDTFRAAMLSSRRLIHIQGGAMVRPLLLFCVLLSMVVCVTSACSGFPNCSPEETPEAPTLYTNDATAAIMGGTKGPDVWEYTYGEFTLHGWLEDMGSSDRVVVSFYWGPNSIPGNSSSYSYPNVCPGTGTGATGGERISAGVFEATLNYWQLLPDTTYYFRAHALGDGSVWGDEYTFHTSPGSALGFNQAVDLGLNGITGVTGQATNRTAQTLSQASVTVVFKDALGAVLETAFYNENVEIPGKSAAYPNGGFWNFNVRYHGTDNSNVASYEISISGE